MEKFIRSDFIYYVAVYNVSILFLFASNQTEKKEEPEGEEVTSTVFPLAADLSENRPKAGINRQSFFKESTWSHGELRFKWQI